ncbi:TonB-dependent receptor [Paracraurococcus lichenis]|uniref:TonB-dependent siderophore receptor n=1 Tax=Paracraurococcus lichenis TaxID=3064888 RepID=A0ABT9E6E1_9PROT|nr:TonB-dependent siderophore receptor [Paracraurococcus sp. LOR1-02]MDO9711706.1 TonB-dependent siderophore receptor [Paracraurococcus sp. LOR1-02]
MSLRPTPAALQPSLGLTGLGVLAALPAAAQTPPATLALPELNVQAPTPPRYRADETPVVRMPTDVREAPQSITVVPRALIEERGATSLREALRNVTGISLAAGEGGFSGDNLTLRGFSARNDFFIDGIRDSAQYTRDPFFLDSVEVLKGPSSIMFGRGSTGGAINLTTRMPKQGNSGELTLTGMTPFGLRSTADVNLAAGDVAVRLNAMAHTQDQSGRTRVNNERWGVAPSATWGLGTNTQLSLHYLHQSEDNVPDFGVPFANGLPVPVSRGAFYGLNNLDRERTETDVVTATMRHRFADGISLRNTTRYGNYTRDIDATAPRLIGTVTPSTNLANVLVNRQPQVRNGVDTILQNQTELRVVANTGPVRHQIVAGLEAGRETAQLARFTTNARPAANLFAPDFYQPFTEIRTLNTNTETTAYTVGAFLVDQMQLGEYFEVLVGGRYDMFNAEYTQLAAATRVSTNFNRTDNMFSWRGALVFKPWTSVRTYFAAGTSFNPSAEALTLAANTANLDPERNRSFELGASWDVTQDLAIRGALFRIEKTNARTPDPTNGTLNVLDGEQRSDGFEVSAAGRITRDWNVIAGYTYIDGEITKSNNPAERGRQLLNTPRNTATLWTSYDLPYGVQLGGGLSYIDARYGNNTNTVRVPAYTRFDAALAWSVTEKVQLRVNALNLTDKRFYEGVYQGNVTPGAGRTFLFTVAARY